MLLILLIVVCQRIATISRALIQKINLNLRILFCIILFSIGVTESQSSAVKIIEVILYKRTNMIGDEAPQWITNCSNVSEELKNSINSINTRGQCARLYDTYDCDDSTGKSIEIMARSPSHRNLQPWGFDDKALSVGICRDSCSPGVTGFLPDHPFNVEIFTGIQYQGIMTIVSVEGCTPVPSDMVNKTFSIRAFDQCVQLYNNKNCDFNKDSTFDPKTVELRLGTPYHDDLTQWGFDKVVTISHCAYKCNRSNSSGVKNSYLKRGDVVLYNEKYFRGNDFGFSLKNITCLNLNRDWEGRAMSIQVGKSTCVVLYDRKNCTGISYSVKSSDSDLYQRYFAAIARSLRPCSDGKTSTLELGLSEEVFVTVIVVPAFAVLLTITLVVCIVRRFRSILLRTRLSEKEIKEFREGLRIDLEKHGEQQYSVNILAENCPYNASYEISRKRIIYDSKLPIGMGQFGMVYKAKIKLTEDQDLGSKQTIPVAIKTAKPGTDIQYLRSLLKEVKVMLYVGTHKHIAQLIGCCTENLQKGELLVLMEYYSNGSLESFLVKNRATFKENLQMFSSNCIRIPQNYENCKIESTESTLQFAQLLQWCVEVASGMEFLSLSKVIHADLATRNVLLTKKLTAKISDFGLSRQLYTYSYYVKKQKEPLPWRWSALESLKNLEFSCESDVWSFGILCWEIFTLGEKPYPGVIWDVTFITHLENGLRPGKPKYGGMECYEIMVCCWDDDPSRRPSFTELHQQLSDLTEMFNGHPRQQ